MRKCHSRAPSPLWWWGGQLDAVRAALTYVISFVLFPHVGWQEQHIGSHTALAGWVQHVHTTAGADGAVASREALALEGATNPAQGRAKEFKALVRQQQAAILASQSALTKAQKQASAPRTAAS